MAFLTFPLFYVNLYCYAYDTVYEHPIPTSAHKLHERQDLHLPHFYNPRVLEKHLLNR